MVEQGNILTRIGSAERLVKSGLSWDRLDLRISEQADLGIATIMSRGLDEQLAQCVSSQFNVELPSGPTRSSYKDISFVGIGPGTWLCCRQGATPTWVGELTSQVAGLASVSDQSSGYTVLRLSGAAARVLLSRGAFIDLDALVFGSGSAAVTDIAHIGVIMWQLDDVPTYEVAIFRSLTESFLHWIEMTSAAIKIPPLVGERIRQTQ